MKWDSLVCLCNVQSDTLMDQLPVQNWHRQVNQVALVDRRTSFPVCSYGERIRHPRVITRREDIPFIMIGQPFLFVMI